MADWTPHIDWESLKKRITPGRGVGAIGLGLIGFGAVASSGGVLAGVIVGLLSAFLGYNVGGVVEEKINASRTGSTTPPASRPPADDSAAKEEQRLAKERAAQLAREEAEKKQQAERLQLERELAEKKREEEKRRQDELLRKTQEEEKRLQQKKEEARRLELEQEAKKQEALKLAKEEEDRKEKERQEALKLAKKEEARKESERQDALEKRRIEQALEERRQEALKRVREEEARKEKERQDAIAKEEAANWRKERQMLLERAKANRRKGDTTEKTTEKTTKKTTERTTERTADVSAVLKRFPATKVGSEKIASNASLGSYYISSVTQKDVDAKTVENVTKSFKDAKGATFKEVDENGFKYVLSVDKGGRKEEWYLQYASAGLVQFINKGNPDLTASAFLDTEPKANSEKILKELRTASDAAIKYEKKSIDAADANKRTITYLQGAFKGWRNVEFKEVNSEGHRYALILGKAGEAQEVWYLTFGVADRDVGRAYFINRDNHQQSFEAYSGMAGTLVQTLRDVRKKSASDAASEKKDEAEVVKFDLPKKRPIGYLAFDGMTDKVNASAFKRSTEFMKYMPELLTRCGYDMVCLDGNPVITPLKRDPAAVVEKRISELYSKGVRDFYLDFQAHGGPYGMYPEYDTTAGKDSSAISPAEMRRIVMRYHNCTFAINTSACYGGGGIDMMRDLRDLPGKDPGRVTVFTRTKEDKLNYDRYQHIMSKYLQDMADGVKDAPATYGEAHRRTDEAVKKIICPGGTCDPEFWKSMPDAPSKRTAKLLNNERRDDSILTGLAKAAKQYFSGHIPPAIMDSKPAHGLTDTRPPDNKSLC